MTSLKKKKTFADYHEEEGKEQTFADFRKVGKKKSKPHKQVKTDTIDKGRRKKNG